MAAFALPSDCQEPCPARIGADHAARGLQNVTRHFYKCKTNIRVWRQAAQALCLVAPLPSLHTPRQRKQRSRHTNFRSRKSTGALMGREGLF